MALDVAGRRRPRRATIAVDGDEFEDGMSVASFDTYETHSSGVEAGAQEGFCSKSETGSVIGGTMDHGSEAQDEFRDAVDQLIEGRASARESGLRKVMHFMLHSTDLELVVSMQSTIMRSLISLLRRKGTEGESVQALKALSVLCVCMGPEEEEAYRSMKRPLRMLITRSRHSGIRVAAVHTLALACFICSSDDDDTQEALELLSKVLSRTSEGLEVPDKLVAAALSGWGLLATTVSRVWVATRMTAEHLKNLRDLLGSKDLDIRMEAGENLALLHESRLLMGLMEGAAEESEDIGEADLPLDWEGEEQGRGTQYTEDGAELGNDAGVAKGDELEGGVAEEGSGDDSGDGDGVREDEEEEEKEEEDDDDDDEEEEVMDLMLLWEEVVEEMKGFVTESSKKLSRETKKQQRRTFRQLLATIGDNEPPEEVVSLQNGSLTVTDWAHIKQLNALRSCLQSGFQAHMESNELLREILGVSSWGGTGDEKHVYSKNSQVRKRQTTTRTRSRNRKILEQEGILGGGACGGW